MNVADRILLRSDGHFCFVWSWFLKDQASLEASLGWSSSVSSCGVNLDLVVIVSRPEASLINVVSKNSLRGVCWT